MFLLLNTLYKEQQFHLKELCVLNLVGLLTFRQQCSGNSFLKFDGRASYQLNFTKWFCYSKENNQQQSGACNVMSEKLDNFLKGQFLVSRSDFVKVEVELQKHHEEKKNSRESFSFSSASSVSQALFYEFNFVNIFSVLFKGNNDALLVKIFLRIGAILSRFIFYC